MQATVAAAHKLVDAIAAAGDGRSFDQAVVAFRRLLATVPDHSPSFITGADIDSLAELAERVIDQIENRLEEHDDRTSIQSDLAKTVYKIRLHLEDIERWRRHFQIG